MQATKRPQRIIWIRHGESQGNTDKSLYETVPDNKIELTEKGIQQAITAARS
jgi:broad specificity phosphatase PhoE